MSWGRWGRRSWNKWIFFLNSIKISLEACTRIIWCF
jgi:hypothetical protein